MDFKKYLSLSLVVATLLLLGSCKGQRSLVIPRAVNIADAIPATALNLHKGDYDILKSVTETASITAKYTNNTLKIISSDGDFSYTFKSNPGGGWNLDKFSGVATFGYLLQESRESVSLPDAEEFARRVAIARLIDVIKDYGADGALEPVITTRVSNVSNKVVEYQATVTAKIVKIHTSN